jgi:hypothetical protein
VTGIKRPCALVSAPWRRGSRRRRGDLADGVSQVGLRRVRVLLRRRKRCTSLPALELRRTTEGHPEERKRDGAEAAQGRAQSPRLTTRSILRSVRAPSPADMRRWHGNRGAFPEPRRRRRGTF